MNDRIAKHNEYKPQYTVSGYPVNGACDTINLDGGHYAYLDTPRTPMTNIGLAEVKVWLAHKLYNRPKKIVLNRGETEHDDTTNEPTSKDV